MRSTRFDEFLVILANIVLLILALWLKTALGDSFPFCIYFVAALIALALDLTYYFARDTANDIQHLIRERLKSPSNGLLRDSPVDPQTSFKKLVVLIHGYQSGPEHLHHIVRTITTSSEMNDAQILIFSYDALRFSTERLWDITYTLYERLYSVFPKTPSPQDIHKEIDDIVLIGHSVGALVARKLLVFSRGEGEPGGPHNRSPIATAWSEKIKTRLILLAGMTRGWDLKEKPPHMPRRNWYLYRTLIAIARFRGQELLVFDAEKGSPFVSNLRLQWFRVTQAALKEEEKEEEKGKTGKKEKKFPTVIQILGTYDDFINSADHNDAQAGGFVLQIAEKAGHYDIISFRQAKLWKRVINRTRYQNDNWEKREKLFLDALINPTDSLQDNLKPELKIKTIPSVKNLVIVLHGIRDKGEWANKLCELGEKRDRSSMIQTTHEKYEEERTFKCLIAAYDRLSMLEFLSSLDRKRAARCLVDAYTEARFIYTNVDLKVHFVGHSNGTYGLGETLANYAECVFEKIVLGGSVLPSGYPWNEQCRRGRFKAMKNYIAKDDCIVALLPKGLELAHLFPILDHDIGGGGFDGFDDDIARRHPVYLNGGHSAITNRKPNTTESKNNIDHVYNSMLDFILTGENKDVPMDMQLRNASRILTLLSTQSYWIWYLTPIVGFSLWGGILAACYWGLTSAMVVWWPDGLINYWWLVPVALLSITFLLGAVFRKVLQTI